MFSVMNDSCKKKLLKVPFTKSEIFSHKSLSFSDKHRLMKFLQFCLDETIDESQEEAKPVKSIKWKNEFGLYIGRSLKRPQNLVVNSKEILNQASNEGASVQGFLKNSFKLSDHLINMILYNIGFYNSVITIDSDDLNGFLRRIRKFVSCIGRFSLKSILIWPEYGFADITENICRKAAINGAIYMLREKVIEIKDNVDQSHLELTFESGKKIQTKSLLYQEKSRLHNLRIVFISSTSVFNESSRSFMIIPPTSLPSFVTKHAMYVFEFDSTLKVVPIGYFMVHCCLEVSECNMKNYEVILQEVLLYLKQCNESWIPLWKTVFSFESESSVFVNRAVTARLFPVSMNTDLDLNCDFENVEQTKNDILKYLQAS